MKRLRISRLARMDMREAFLYIRGDSPAAATRFRKRISEVFEKLAEMPGMGRHREEFEGEVRSSSIPPHIIFYELEGEEVRILRVVHGARDLDELFS